MFNAKHKIAKTLVLMFVFGFLFFSFGVNAEVSPDAIAIRVIPNPEHYSPVRWYMDQGFTGSPQSLLVDGYEAVRDGRSVYVNAANLGDDGGMYTNIYLISYNQDVEDVTLDIFGQILAHWKFNSNLEDSEGTCFNPDSDFTSSENNCRVDGDCLIDELCDSTKAKLVRDTKRLSDLVEIKIYVENYKTANSYYPKLSAGTYLPNKTISVWPSWQDNFAGVIGFSNLPVDPRNKLGACNTEDGYDFDSDTCWDEENKSFWDHDGDDVFELPDNSFVYVYEGSSDGSDYSIQAVMESGYVACDDVENDFCFAGSNVSHQGQITEENQVPTINCNGLTGAAFREFNEAYISAYDANGDELSWGNIDMIGAWTGWQGLELKSTLSNNVKKVYATKAGDIGTYRFNITVNDGNGGEITKECSIVINTGAYCGDGVVDGDRGETCDEGSNNTDTICSVTYNSAETCSYCDTECILHEITGAYCGDGNLNSSDGEVCDDGADGPEGENNGDYGKCKTDCSGIGDHCGDGIKNGPEACDDGNDINDDACLNSCQLASCGDGIVGPGEQCDDANTVETDDCVNCSNAICGDGYIWSGNEVCDDGTNNGVYNYCKLDCSGIGAHCGDGNLDPEEACEVGDDHCSDCQCSAGYNLSGGVCCEDFVLNPIAPQTIYTFPVGATLPLYYGPVAYNVNVSVISSEPITFALVNEPNWLSVDANGLISGTPSNAGNYIVTLLASNSCGTKSITFEIEVLDNSWCGDGTPDAGEEECDDGNLINTDNCLNICKSATCGDGYLKLGEECDDGNTNNNDGCSSNCIVEFCGDGVQQAGEECDDGNAVDGDNCTNLCTTSYCGDGYVQNPNANNEVELCDDGNDNNNDNCTNSCDIPYLVNNVHIKTQCINSGGTVVSSGANYFCKFAGATCPVGWSQYENWSTNENGWCDGIGGVCGCNTGEHAFSNEVRESCVYYRNKNVFGNCTNSRTCWAIVTEVGCY